MASEHDGEERSSPLSSWDKLVHEPARLAILTMLEGVAKADFTFLQRMLALTQGNLSSHLSKLETAGLVTIGKTEERPGPRTFISITDRGRRAVLDHWNRLEELRHYRPGG